MARPSPDKLQSIWLRVVTELVDAAPITEAYLKSKDTYVDGMCEGGSITINPAHNVVDTLIHELLHRIYPERSERSIRRTTTVLRKHISDEEVQWFYDEYQRRKRKGSTRDTDAIDDDD
jgi:hypothetical protein